jgi:hypothetical protein
LNNQHERIKELENQLSAIEKILDISSKHEKQPEKWYENIPDGGVLCWVTDNGCADERICRNIIRYQKRLFKDGLNNWEKARLLTKQEIQVFMDNVPEEV